MTRIKNVVDQALDMSRRARMERAREMGFGARDYFHGSPDLRGVREGFSSRTIRARNRRTGEFEDLPQATYVTPDQPVARSYADPERAWDYQNAEEGVLPLRVRDGGLLEIDAQGKRFNQLPLERVRDQIPESQRAAFDDLVDQYADPMLLANEGSMRTGDLEVIANKLGYPGFRIRNVRDTYSGGGSPTEIVAVYDPARFRSPEAAFDPSQRDSSNLLAGVGGAAVGAGILGAGVAPQEAEAGIGSNVARRMYPIASRDKWWSDADYTARGGEVVEMSPDEFLSYAAPLEIDDVARDNIDDLKSMMGSGRELDPLKLYPGEGVRASDGRHRAIAARELGIQSVPVVDFRRAGRAAGFARPGAMAATGAAGALASFLNMRSKKQDTPYKRFIAEGQRAVEQAIGAGENIGNLAASILAEPIAGYAGLVAGPEAVQRTRDYFAPQSMSPAAQQQMIGLGNTLESAGQQIMSGLDAAGQAVGVDRLSDYARYAPGYWEQRVVPALQREFGTRAGSALAATLRAAPEAL